ncbi:MAG TPA: hypothetical protein VFM15_10655 [Gammaproteobacteria bacterium]|nr:hypothetical protein [Gammaproteobacteria bacterium]
MEGIRHNRFSRMHAPALRGMLIPLLWILACLLAAEVSASDRPAHITVLQSKAGGPYEKFTRAFTHDLDAGKVTTPVSILIAGEEASARLERFDAGDLLVTVGTGATQSAIRSGTSASILSVLVPRYAVEQFKPAPRMASRLTYIYLDQPLSRCLALTRLVLPRAAEIGVLLGPVSAVEEPALRNAAQASHLKLRVANMAPGADTPLPALATLLDRADVLLALPDASVYNRYSLSPLLLTTFRYRIPVIGYSAALVHAGAIAGVYSTPEQIARQAAELVQKPVSPARGVYPRYFEVGLNPDVARALDIPLPDKADLERQLRQVAP